MAITSVDPDALRAAADRLDAAADLALAGIRQHASGLQFDASSAGRAHIAAGAAVRGALDAVTGDVLRWARAARELAAALRAGAGLHAAAERDATAALR